MKVGTRHEALFVDEDLPLLRRVLTDWLRQDFASPSHPDRQRATILLAMLTSRRVDVSAP